MLRTADRVCVQDYFEYEVNYILDSVVTSLSEDPMRKFIEVEMQVLCCTRIALCDLVGRNAACMNASLT